MVKISFLSQGLNLFWHVVRVCLSSWRVLLYHNGRGKTTVFCEQYVNHSRNFFILWTYSVHNYEWMRPLKSDKFLQGEGHGFGRNSKCWKIWKAASTQFQTEIKLRIKTKNTISDRIKKYKITIRKFDFFLFSCYNNLIGMNKTL